MTEKMDRGMDGWMDEWLVGLMNDWKNKIKPFQTATMVIQWHLDICLSFPLQPSLILQSLVTFGLFGPECL